MKQKLGLACTLVRTPQLLLLDEPTVGVDPLSRRELWEIVEQLIADEHTTVLVSTAYLDEAERCARVFLMHSGRMLAVGTPQELRAHATGRSFSVAPNEGEPARRLQARLLDDAAQIIDAVPYAGEVRFVTAQPTATPDMSSLTGTSPRAVAPRLEDGFMVLLRARQQAAQSPATDDTIGAAGAHAVELDADEYIIVVRDLVRKFGAFTAVQNTSFSVRRGEVFGLLGPNGAGKTTTFRMLCGLLPATGGSLRVAGVDLRTARASARQHIGYVSQKFALYGNLSVRENMDFFAGAYGLHGARARARSATLLRQFDLLEMLDARTSHLPAGFQRRLAMAAALLHDPAILFLDEPTSGADPRARREFWRRITALSERGTTVVVTTHFMDEAEYCDRIVIQDAGSVLALGTPQQVRQLAFAASAADRGVATDDKDSEARTASPTVPDAASDALPLTMEEAFIHIVQSARARGRAESIAGRAA